MLVDGRLRSALADAVFITLLSPILSVLQMQGAVRQIIFGLIILAMLLVRLGKRRAAL